MQTIDLSRKINLTSKPRLAIIGSGISGLGAAWALRNCAHITLFESNDYFGGHTHTVDIELANLAGQRVKAAVDTGFLVYNENTYPQLIRLFQDLQIPTAKTDMSFSVQVPDAKAPRGVLEWSGSTPGSLFCQRGNLLRPDFWLMLRDMLRFNQQCTQLARAGKTQQLAQPLGDFLRSNHYCKPFIDWYLLPMLACIWSCPQDQMLQFPVATMIRFCHNHGLLQILNRPQWHTVSGGARQYVEKIVATCAEQHLATPIQRVQACADGQVLVHHAKASESFDAVLVATHAPQALALLPEADAATRSVLAAMRCQSNHAVLHTDSSVMPRARSAWAAWNFERAAHTTGQQPQVCLHYWLNRLQPLPQLGEPDTEHRSVFVTLNPVKSIARHTILKEFDYEHPIFDADAIVAQQKLVTLQGRGNIWFAGAWCGYGFHEDGLKAGLAAAQSMAAHWGLRL